MPLNTHNIPDNITSLLPSDIKPHPGEQHERHKQSEPVEIITTTKKDEPPLPLDIVSLILNNTGMWRPRVILLASICRMATAWFTAIIIFTAPVSQTGDYHCQDSMLEAATTMPHYNCTIPCNDIVHTRLHRSIVSVFNLVCADAILVPLTQFWHLFGVLLGGLFANYISKFCSPKFVLVVSLLGMCFCGISTGLAPTYTEHIFYRCLAAACCNGATVASMQIIKGLTYGTDCKIGLCSNEALWSIGVVTLPALAVFAQHWNYLYYAISMPCLVMVFITYFLPDCPRWLIAHNQFDEAARILRRAAQFNKRLDVVPENLHYQLQQIATKVQSAARPFKWWTLFSGNSKIRANMIRVHIAWPLFMLCFYGVLLNVRIFSRDYLHINTAIAGIAEVVGIVIGLFLIIYTRRVWLWSGILSSCGGLLTLGIWFVPTSLPHEKYVFLTMCTAMCSKVAISTSVMILLCCQDDLLPAAMHRKGALSTYLVTRTLLLNGPWMANTAAEYGKMMPQTMYAAMVIIGGLTMMFVDGSDSNTKDNSNIYETLEVIYPNDEKRCKQNDEKC